MRRRDFIGALGGAAALPLTAKVATFWQVADYRISRLGHAHKLEAVGGGVPGLHELGWIEGRTLAIEYRWRGPHRAHCGVSRRIRSTQRRCHCLRRECSLMALSEHRDLTA